MLEAVLAYLNNWFIVERLKDTFTAEGGLLTGELPEGFLVEGQYFRIVGSVFNDGLHCWPADELTDETFEGTLYSLAIPAEVFAITAEIEQWCEKYLEQTQSPYSSESFGGYSYQKANGTDAPTWQSVFAKRLSRWRKL